MIYEVFFSSDRYITNIMGKKVSLSEGETNSAEKKLGGIEGRSANRKKT